MARQEISSSNERSDFQSAKQPMDFQSIVVELWMVRLKAVQAISTIFLMQAIMAIFFGLPAATNL